MVADFWQMGDKNNSKWPNDAMFARVAPVNREQRRVDQLMEAVSPQKTESKAPSGGTKGEQPEERKTQDSSTKKEKDKWEVLKFTRVDIIMECCCRGQRSCCSHPLP